MEKIEIRVPAADAETIARHVFWIKQTGDKVAKGAAVASVEASKGLTFIAAPANGTLCEQTVAKGELVNSGDIIGFLESE